jgi:hypothetical protein
MSGINAASSASPSAVSRSPMSLFTSSRRSIGNPGELVRVDGIKLHVVACTEKKG